MIKIINQGKRNSKGQTLYKIYINDKYITDFYHKREFGLGMCLLEASKKVEKEKYNKIKEMAKIIDKE